MLASAVLRHFATGVAICGATVGFFGAIDYGLTKEARSEISRWLRAVSLAEHFQHWPKTFTEVYDRLFTKNYVSLTCFLRSCIVSLAVVAGMTISWVALHPGGLDRAAVSLLLVGAIFLKPDIHLTQVTPTSCSWGHSVLASQSATIERYGVGSTAMACCTRR